MCDGKKLVLSKEELEPLWILLELWNESALNEEDVEVCDGRLVKTRAESADRDDVVVVVGVDVFGLSKRNPKDSVDDWRRIVAIIIEKIADCIVIRSTKS